MPVINMVYNIKEIFPDYVVFIRIGISMNVIMMMHVLYLIYLVIKLKL